LFYFKMRFLYLQKKKEPRLLKNGNRFHVTFWQIFKQGILKNLPKSTVSMKKERPKIFEGVFVSFYIF